MSDPSRSDPPPGEPEPVDAEFEDAEPLLQNSPEEAETKRSRAAGPIAIVLAAVVAAGPVGGLAGYLAATQSAPAGSPLPAASDPAVLSALETRLSALEDAPAPQPAEPADLAPVMSRLDALESRVAALESAPAADPQAAAPAASPELAGRIREIEQRLETAILDAGSAAENAAVALSAAQDAATRAQTAETVAAEAAQQASSAPAPASAAAAPSPAPQVLDRLDSLSARLDALETFEAQAAGQLQSVQDAAADAGSAADQALTLARELANADPSAPARLAERALALAALRDAAAGEQSFEAERAALARVWSGREELSVLSRHARGGVDDLRSLTRAFPADAILEAAGGRRAFFGVVSVRPEAGGGAADDPARIVADAELALADGALPQAIEAIERLDGPAAEAARGWLQAARARAEVDAAVASLRASLAAEGDAP